MKRDVLSRMFFYPAVGIFSCLAVGGGVLSFQAQQENYRLGLALNQVLRIVARAQEVRSSKLTQPQQELAKLVTKLVREDGFESRYLQKTKDNFSGTALVNPWGDPLEFSLAPTKQELHLVMPVTSHHCRRFLEFYTQDAASLGLMRVDVMSDMAYKLWRMVYDAKRMAGSEMSKETIRVNCGNSDRAAVSLVFRIGGT
jgi:hypothetical protein